MGKVEIFCIELNKQNSVYCPGENITGLVRIKLKERLKLKSVKIIIKGSSKGILFF